MKKIYKMVYFTFFSLLYSLQSISFINQPGDQTWFQNMAKKYHYDYFKFALDRYQNWSSRLFIESATMFFSVNYLLFDLVLFIATLILFYVLSDIIVDSKIKESSVIVFLIPIIFIYIFPTDFFLGAGLIATITNYYFPMVLFIVAMWLITKKNKIAKILSFLFLIPTVMQEQFALISFLFLLYLIIYYYKNNNKFSRTYIIAFLISILSIFSMLFSPGSQIRKLKEVKAWYPKFDHISVFKKICLGFFDTNNSLFFGNQITAIYILLILFIILALYKKEILILISSICLFSMIISDKLGIKTLFYSLKTVVANLKNYNITVELIYVWLMYLTLLLFLAFAIYRLISNYDKKIFLIYIVVIGYLGRMSVSFSPTIYASGVRTHLPVLLSIYIVIMFLIKELYVELTNLEKKGLNNEKT